jgi:hypothetical protein
MSICKTGNLFVNTVPGIAGNQTKYTNRNYLHAVLAQKIQKMIRRPSTRSFIAIVEKNLLLNWTEAATAVANHLFEVNAKDLVMLDKDNKQGNTIPSSCGTIAIPVQARLV